LGNNCWMPIEVLMRGEGWVSYLEVDSARGGRACVRLKNCDGVRREVPWEGNLYVLLTCRAMTAALSSLGKGQGCLDMQIDYSHPIREEGEVVGTATVIYCGERVAVLGAKVNISGQTVAWAGGIYYET